MIDATGVLWTGLDTVVPGAQEVVKFLRQKVCVLFLSSSVYRPIALTTPPTFPYVIVNPSPSPHTTFFSLLSRSNVIIIIILVLTGYIMC